MPVMFWLDVDDPTQSPQKDKQSASALAQTGSPLLNFSQALDTAVEQQ
jgi:hypothetical protein